jgi:hypothetical protein
MEHSEMRKSACPPPGTWVPYLLCGTIAVTCLLSGDATSAFGQHVSVGIKAGVPLADFVQLLQSDVSIGGQPARAQTKRYTVGPVVDVSFPRGWGLEVGAMYKRFDEQAGEITVGPQTCGFSEEPARCLTSTRVSAVGQSWEVPIAGQYRMSLSLLRPYIEAGFSYNHLSNVFAPFSPFPSPVPIPVGQVVPPPRDSVNRKGVLLGIGAELKLSKIHVIPGLRYAHYNNKNAPVFNGPRVFNGPPDWLPSTNSVDFLLGFTF